MKKVSCINTTNLRKTFGEEPINIYGQLFDYKKRGTKFGDVILLIGNFYALGDSEDNVMLSKNLCLPDYLTDFLVDELNEESGGFLDFCLMLDYEDYYASAYGYHYTRTNFTRGGCAEFIANNV